MIQDYFTLFPSFSCPVNQSPGPFQTVLSAVSSIIPAPTLRTTATVFAGLYSCPPPGLHLHVWPPDKHILPRDNWTVLLPPNGFPVSPQKLQILLRGSKDLSLLSGCSHLWSDCWPAFSDSLGQPKPFLALRHRKVLCNLTTTLAQGT